MNRGKKMKLDLKNKVSLLILSILILIFVICIYFVLTRLCWKGCTTTDLPIPKTDNISVVPTMHDNIQQDTAWCGTFQLVWNDMIKEVVGQEVKWEEPLAMVDNLNKQDFNESSISEAYYYKKFGLKTLDLKTEIEKGIREKFNETSNVLGDIDWSQEALDQGREDVKRYLFYTMLKRDFSYEKEFTKLENGKFANQYDNVKYFGIDATTEKAVRKQVEVLYHNSEEDFAVLLYTVEGDQVYVCKGTKASTFHEIYNEMVRKADSYSGNRTFGELDYLKIPEITFDVKREYTELENKKFYGAQKNQIEIVKAIQTIQLQMDEKGGSIKSEAVMDVLDKAAAFEPEEQQPRYFYFDDEYVLFLLEEGKEKPYFATCISDITKFQ